MSAGVFIGSPVSPALIEAGRRMAWRDGVSIDAMESLLRKVARAAQWEAFRGVMGVIANDTDE